MIRYIFLLAMAALPCQAALLTFDGTLSNTDPTYNRVLAGNPPGGLSGVGTSVFYDTYDFVVTGPALFRLETITGVPALALDDSFLSVYVGSFNPAAP